MSFESLLRQVIHLFPKRPDRLLGPPSLLFSGYRIFFYQG